MICAFGKISENLAQENSLDICVLRPLSKCSMSSIFSIRKFCCVQVSLSVIQFKMWQKYIETNRTVVNRFINYVQKYNSKHELLVFFYKLKKTNLLYSSYLKKKKRVESMYTSNLDTKMKREWQRKSVPSRNMHDS